MISKPSDPEKPDVPLVLDASVVINLLATGQVEVILGTLSHAVVVEEIARQEVRWDPRGRGSAQPAMQALTDAGVLALEAMGSAAEAIFFELTGAEPPNDLGDGEAATIAHAIVIGGGAAIDERKANRVVGERYPSLARFCTLDILRLPCVAERLSAKQLREAVYDALVYARMRVPATHQQWVRNLLGVERAAACWSLRCK